MKPHSETVERAMLLVRTLAAMTKDGENGYDMPNDDAVDALHSAIDTARDILETDADLNDPTSVLRGG